MDETITKSLLLGIADDGLEEILSAFEHRSFEVGDTIIQMGDEGDELFLLVAGKVRVWTGEGPAIAERTLSVLGPGEHFGEASMVSGRPRTATVTALTYIETLVLKRADYQRLMPKHPELLQNISRSLTRRLSQMNVFTSQARRPKRGIHSLGIVIDTPTGWALASALLGQLRQHGHIVHPMVVTDGEPPMQIDELDSDVAAVDASELGIEVAKRSRGKSLAVAIAHGENASKATAKECDRVIFAISQQASLEKSVGKLALTIPEHRRCIAAMMFDATIDTRPVLDDPRLRCVRVKYTPSATGLPHLARLDDASVQRMSRCLAGIRIGLALGGGGARGIAHVGVTQVFADHGIVFDSIAGTSAGAIVAGAVAAGHSSREVGQFFRDDMIPPKLFASRPALRRAHLLHSFRGGRFEKKLRRYLHRLTFEQLDVPLSITTLDLISGVQLIRREGDVVHAILQSINHPVFGSPIIQGDEMLVDGGVLMNVPASVLREEECDYVISVDVGSRLSTNFATDKNGKLRRPGYLSTLLRTMELSRRHSSEIHALESDLIISPETEEFRIEDFHAVEPLIEAGIKAGESSYADVKRLIDSITPVSVEADAQQST
ncbi:MAG: cyclic nucleotide-binding domain-containing protein [Pirellulaceae bacterium]|nr:cyclic nucleotide-binding domain-containing protein [Pirellulaceae bacterium]